jgi:dTDP-4-amino-4,6-dideoxygalactose transaminase
MQPVFNVEGQSTNLNSTRRMKSYKIRKVGGEVAEDLFSRGLCLPSGTAMTEADLDRVVSTILKCQR